MFVFKICLKQKFLGTTKYCGGTAPECPHGVTGLYLSAFTSLVWWF